MNNITSVLPGSPNDSINIEYNLIKMVLLCHPGYKDLTDDKKIKYELKWYICFRILFYMDQLHDFIEGRTTSDKTILENLLWNQFHNEIQNLLFNFYPRYAVYVVNTGYNDIDKYYKSYGKFITEIFDVYRTDQDGQHSEYKLLNGDGDNIFTGIKEGLFRYYINYDKDASFPIDDLSNNNKYYYADLAYNIMGLRKISVPTFQEKYVPNHNNSRDYTSTVIKMIYYNCHDGSFNNRGPDLPLYVFVDALQSQSKLGALNDYNMELINYNKLFTYITPADLVDASPGNAIYNLIKEKGSGYYNKLSLEKNYNLIIKYSFSHLSILLTDPQLLSRGINNGKYSVSQSFGYVYDDEIIKLHYKYVRSNNNFNLIVAKFFDTNYFENGTQKIDKIPMIRGQITTRDVNRYLTSNIPKKNPTDDSDIELESKKIVKIMANKSVLDLSKSLFTLYIIEHVIQTRDFNYYIVYTDRIGGFISASIGTSTITAAGNDLKNYEYINFLGTKQKFSNGTISPQESKSLYDNSPEEPGEEVTSRSPSSLTSLSGLPSGLLLHSPSRSPSPRLRSRDGGMSPYQPGLPQSTSRDRSPSLSRLPRSHSLSGERSRSRSRGGSPQSFDRRQLTSNFGKKQINTFGKKIKGNSKKQMKPMLNFGRRKREKFIQEANRRSVIKGTVGMFGKWCHSQGLASPDGKVTLKCINKAKRSGNTKLIRRATFAKNIGGYLGAKHHRRSKFGKKKKFTKFTKKKKFTKPRKSVKRGNLGRKSPGTSATIYKVGIVKRGLDGNNWVVVKIKNGIKRWKKVSMKLDKKVRRKFRFGNETPLDHKREQFEEKIQQEIKIAEKIIDSYPENDTLKRRAMRLLGNIKKLIKRLFKIDNLETFVEKSVRIMTALTTLLLALSALTAAYNGMYAYSTAFAGVVSPLERLFNRFRKKNNQNEQILEQMGRMGKGHWVFEEEE